jgi:hypothetical protein
MDNLARKLELELELERWEQGGLVQQVGTVVRAEGVAVRVRTETGEYGARRAVSCLVQPELDDEVLVACRASGACYVLAVLEREPGAATTLQVEGDLQVQVPAGSFGVAAQEGVSVVSAKDTTLVSGRIDVRAVEGSVALERLTYWGRVIRSEVEKIKLLAGSFDSVLERWSQKVKRAYRNVEQLDQLRAQSIDYRADKTMSLHAGNALVTAEELVKIDGEQIHLG